MAEVPEKILSLLVDEEEVEEVEELCWMLHFEFQVVQNCSYTAQTSAVLVFVFIVFQMFIP